MDVAHNFREYVCAGVDQISASSQLARTNSSCRVCLAAYREAGALRTIGSEPRFTVHWSCTTVCRVLVCRREFMYEAVVLVGFNADWL